MTDEQTIEPMSEEDVAAFSSGLQEWAATRSPKEQAFLGNLLLLASQADPEDVQGYWFGATLTSAGQTATTMAPVAGVVWPGFGPQILQMAGQVLQTYGTFFSAVDAKR